MDQLDVGRRANWQQPIGSYHSRRSKSDRTAKPCQASDFTRAQACAEAELNDNDVSLGCAAPACVRQ